MIIILITDQIHKPKQLDIGHIHNTIFSTKSADCVVKHWRIYRSEFSYFDKHFLRKVIVSNIGTPPKLLEPSSAGIHRSTAAKSKKYKAKLPKLF